MRNDTQLLVAEAMRGVSLSSEKWSGHDLNQLVRNQVADLFFSRSPDLDPAMHATLEDIHSTRPDQLRRLLEEIGYEPSEYRINRVTWEDFIQKRRSAEAFRASLKPYRPSDG